MTHFVGQDAQLQHAVDEATRLAQKSEQLARERRQAEEERETIGRRQGEERESITRLENDQRSADDRLAAAQRRLFEARVAAEDLSHRTAEARAALRGQGRGPARCHQRRAFSLFARCYRAEWPQRPQPVVTDLLIPSRMSVPFPVAR